LKRTIKAFLIFIGVLGILLTAFLALGYLINTGAVETGDLPASTNYVWAIGTFGIFVFSIGCFFNRLTTITITAALVGAIGMFTYSALIGSYFDMETIFYILFLFVGSVLKVSSTIFYNKATVSQHR